MNILFINSVRGLVETFQKRLHTMASQKGDE